MKNIEKATGSRRLLIGTACIVGCMLAAASARAQESYRSPIAVAAAQDAHEIFVAEGTANEIAVVKSADGTVARRIALPEPARGLAIAPDGKTLYATNATVVGSVRFVDAASGEVRGAVAVGHTPMAPVVSPDGATLYVCNRFTNDVSVVDVAAKAETARIAVAREPVAAALAPDGKTLYVANLLPVGASDGDFIAAVVSVIDTGAKQVRATVTLPNGSSSLRGICVSPDGKYVYVTHILARYQMPTTQLERGWMNTNALSILDAAQGKLLNTVLLDDVDLGAANPWSVACTADGKLICVAHAGTHEISVVDRAALHAKLDKVAAGEPVNEVSSSAADVPNDLSFLNGIRRRIKLLGNGPRAVFLAGATAYVAEYFTDSLSVVDVADAAKAKVRAIAIGPAVPLTPARKGELLFHDGAMCFQQWQSCISCHPDARVDGLNWDLLNDGIGNPKNTKSMLLSHKTPPVMALGVRETAEMAVRSGMKFIQFTVRPEADAVALDEYLKGLIPVLSPHLVKGELSPEAKRGKEIFTRAGCAACHPEPLYTDKKQYDLGTGKGMDAGKPFDTPTLVEVWRTAPYLHDGRAANLLEVLKKHNAGDKHGKTSDLKEQEINDLAEFVLSL